MAANTSDPPKGHGGVESESDDYVQELVCWGLNQYEGEDCDPANIDQWEWPDHGHFDVDTFTADSAGPWGEVGPVAINLMESELIDIDGEVFYGRDGVSLSYTCRNKHTRLTCPMRLDPHEAMELAVAIFAAAWECRSYRQQLED